MDTGPGGQNSSFFEVFHQGKLPNFGVWSYPLVGPCTRTVFVEEVKRGSLDSRIYL